MLTLKQELINKRRALIQALQQGDVEAQQYITGILDGRPPEGMDPDTDLHEVLLEIIRVSDIDAPDPYRMAIHDLEFATGRIVAQLLQQAVGKTIEDAFSPVYWLSKLLYSLAHLTSNPDAYQVLGQIERNINVRKQIEHQLGKYTHAGPALLYQAMASQQHPAGFKSVWERILCQGKSSEEDAKLVYSAIEGTLQMMKPDNSGPPNAEAIQFNMTGFDQKWQGHEKFSDWAGLFCQRFEYLFLFNPNEPNIRILRRLYKSASSSFQNALDTHYPDFNLHSSENKLSPGQTLRKTEELEIDPKSSEVKVVKKALMAEAA